MMMTNQIPHAISPALADLIRYLITRICIPVSQTTPELAAQVIELGLAHQRYEWLVANDHCDLAAIVATLEQDTNPHGDAVTLPATHNQALHNALRKALNHTLRPQQTLPINT